MQIEKEKNMRKSAVIKHLPNLKQYRKDLKAKQALATKLDREIGELDTITFELDGVSLHQDFPIMVVDAASGNSPDVEIFSACDESNRYAYVSRDSQEGQTPERWRATGYKEEGSTEARVLIEGASRLAAVRAGKDYVATGKLQVKPAKPAKTPKTS